jgi:hypothetical protein
MSTKARVATTPKMPVSNAISSMTWFLARFPLDAIIILFLYHVTYAVRPDDFREYEPWESFARHGPRKDALRQVKEMLLEQEAFFNCGEQAKLWLIERIADMNFQGGKIKGDRDRGYKSEKAELNCCLKCRERQFTEFEEDRRRWGRRKRWMFFPKLRH